VTVLVVVLAAGGGRRFAASGGVDHKLLVPLDGEALVARAVRAALDAAVGEVVVVQGAVDLRGHLPAGVEVVDNPRWGDGIATSLQAAVATASAGGHAAVLVGLGDQPDIGPAPWRAVADAPPDPPIAVATYDGRRGNPVRLGAAVWDLLPTSGDDGARVLMRDRPDLVREVPCIGDPQDVDTVEDLDRWS
jgi:molybdenum cofactor cytidylyltransferase